MSGGLYLGSLSVVNDPPLLCAHGITHLVQALEAPWAPLARKEDGFVAYSIDIRDKGSVDLRPHLEAPRGEGVLVHCQQGVSRSPSIVIAYLIRNHAMSYDAALAFVKRKHACARPNPGFARAHRVGALVAPPRRAAPLHLVGGSTAVVGGVVGRDVPASLIFLLFDPYQSPRAI
ncbi:protein-tyrosine phosphatase-like protein [Mycena latifolia]|nr:protein-tyrosine phosphatase-like protein [Mycena latifolia]